MTNYFNTTHLSGADLATEVHNAEKQESKVLVLFKIRNRPMSPSQVHRELEKYGERLPMTSVRRAMTNLSNQGELMKTDTTVIGIYKKPEHLWSMPRVQGDLFG